MEKIIDAQKIYFAYQSGEEYQFALSGATLDIKRGELACVLGHNGSGKSTLARHMNALLIPAEGNMIVAGMNTRDEKNTLDIRRTAGMVFQNPDNQLVATIVEEDVAFGPENLGVPQEEIVERVYFALNMVNMGDFAKRAPHMLSGGQKQRVAIAGVLAMKPDIIIFDEATAMLDPAGRREVLETIEYLNKQEGKTIVMITHFMEEAEKADKVFVMRDGTVTASGTPAEVFEQKEILKQAGLRMPFATSLCAELAGRGADVPANVVGMKAAADAICAAYERRAK